MTFDTPHVADLKTGLRKLAKQRRRDWVGDADIAARQAAENVKHSISLEVKNVFAAYAAYGTELDAWPLMHDLYGLGMRCCLPVMTGLAQALEFRQWSPQAELAPSPMGILEPIEGAKKLRPEILVLPLLAFDRRGHRLGYGGGYFDRTLQKLRSTGTVTAIGFGYSFQEVEVVPNSERDEALDWIVTDTEVIRIGGEGR